MILSNSFKKNSSIKIPKLISKSTLFLSLPVFICAIIYIITTLDNNQNNLDILSSSFSKKLIPFLILVFIFQFLNWILEAFKLKILLKSEKKLPFLMIVKAVYVGNLTSLITPKRLGNFIGRSWILKKHSKYVIISTISGNFVQLFTTLLMAFFSFFYFSIYNLKGFNFFNPFIKEITFFYGLGSIIFCFLIFNNQWHSIFNKITFLKCMNQPVGYLGNISFKKRLYVVLVSILRYTVFMFQYYFLFNGLMMSFDFFDAIILISLLFGIVSFLPSLAPGNLGTREAVSILLLGGTIVSVQFSSVSFLVWFFNVAISGLIGGLIILSKQVRTWKY